MANENSVLPNFPELQFDGSNHTYTLNGQELPSVTTVMRPLNDAFYHGIDADVILNAANRGTAIHHAVENYILYGLEDISVKNQGYFNAFLQWWDDYEPDPIAMETRTYHKSMRYSGTVDLSCWIEGKKVLVDYKTSAVVNKMLTGVQLEAYAKAYESHGFKFDEKAIVHLKNDGSYKFIKYKSPDPESWEVFGSLMVVWNHIQKHKQGGHK